LLGILFVVGMTGCRKNERIPAATDVTEATRNPLRDLTTAAIDGERLFRRNCTICHGLRGAGDGPSRSTLTAEPANLTIDPVASFSDGRMFLSIRQGKMVNGRLTMPPVEKISDEEIWKTIAYVRTLTAGSGGGQ
jgi:mono/diheme cytochrome c family protein